METDMVSQSFIDGVKAYCRTQEDLARSAEVNPSILSRILNKRKDVMPGDPVVLAVAEILGMDPEECFDNN